MGIDRRKFIQKAGLAGAGMLSFTPGPNHLFPSFNFKDKPSALQQSWMDLKFGMFIHFGINTYFDKEWSEGTLDPYHVNPVRLDTDQWCRLAKNAGMKYIVIVAKHHDGFCLWPSRFSDYTISRSQYNRDILAALAGSAAKAGLKLGFYYSLWDQHMNMHIQDEWEYIGFIKDQLQELLTNYGPVLEIWFDGFWRRQQSGWTKLPEPGEGEDVTLEQRRQRDEDFINAWRMEGAYRWQMDHLYNFIKSLQPDCLVMNNSTSSYPGVPLFPVDVRSGERFTDVEQDRKHWQWLGKETFLPLQIETTMSTKGNQRFPAGNWFWHEWDHSVLSAEEIRTYLAKADTIGANLLLNVGPDRKGLIRGEDIKVLSELNAE